MPIRDDSAGSYGTWNNDDLSWLDYLKANASDGGNALANLGRNLVQGFSPIGTSEQGNMALQVPPIVSGIAQSYGRLAGTPNNPGNAYNLTGVPELDAPIQQDMSNVLLSLYGGNAAAGLAKGGAAAVESATPSLVSGRPRSAAKKALTLEGGPQGHRAYDGPLFPRAAWALDRAKAVRDGLADYREGRREYYGHGVRESAQGAYYYMMGQKANADNSLFDNLRTQSAGGTSPFHYDIISPDGSQFGTARGNVVGDTMYFDWLGSHGYTDGVATGPNTLGVSGVRALREQVRKDFPDVKSFTGHRVSGARDKARAENRTQIVNLLSDNRPSLLGSALATAGENPKGINVWHGSPHDFDKFDMSKIGTGEGAQAYGHGLYFADSDAVAKSYQSMPSSDPAAYDAGLYKAVYGDDAYNAAVMNGDPRTADYLKAEKDGTLQKGGYLYQARINANPEDFLDWDKPLSEQSEAVRSGIRDAAPHKFSHDAAVSDGLTGESAYKNYIARGGPEDVSSLRAAGVPGIRYLDGNSRGSGEGSHNYVVFDDSLIDTLHKWRGDTQLYSDTSRPSIFGSALATGGENYDLPEWLRF